MIQSQRRQMYVSLEKMTGISVHNFECAERALLLEDRPSQIGGLLRRSYLPPAHEILRKLFSRDALRDGESRFRFTSSSDMRKLKISCRLRLTQKRVGLRSLTIAKIQIVCKVVNDGWQGGHCEFHQEIVVVGNKFCSVGKRRARYQIQAPAFPEIPTITSVGLARATETENRCY